MKKIPILYVIHILLVFILTNTLIAFYSGLSIKDGVIQCIVISCSLVIGYTGRMIDEEKEK